MLAIGCMGFGGPSVLEPLSSRPPRCACGGRQVSRCDQARGHGGTQFPVIPGLDAVGIVETVGSRVDHIRVGQRVLAFPHTGTYAEYVVADGNLTFPVPEGLPLEQAIACPLVTFTSWMLLHKVAALEPGETLLIHAASGGIGTTVIQMARNLGGRQESSALSAALPSGRRPWMPERTTCFACQTAPLPRPCWIEPAAEGRM